MLRRYRRRTSPGSSPGRGFRLGHPSHQTGHAGTELLPDLVDRAVGVLHHIVENRRDQYILIMDTGTQNQDLQNLEEMLHIRLSGGPPLVPVESPGELHGRAKTLQ